MDALTIAAASGLRSRMESLDLLANNLANAATSGFKSDREFYGVYSSLDSDDGSGGGPSSSMPLSSANGPTSPPASFRLLAVRWM